MTAIGITAKDVLAKLLEFSYYDQKRGAFIRTALTGGNQRNQIIGEPVGTTNNYGYLVIGLLGERFLISRLIWAAETGDWPTGLVDHYDQDKKNNHISNLRIGGQLLNGGNKKLYKNNKTGYVGVSYSKNLGMYKASVTPGGKRIHCGYFATAEEAYNARQLIIDSHPEWGFTKNHGK
jgi:hypothetical protein